MSCFILAAGTRNFKFSFFSCDKRLTARLSSVCPLCWSNQWIFSVKRDTHSPFILTNCHALFHHTQLRNSPDIISKQAVTQNAFAFSLAWSWVFCHGLNVRNDGVKHCFCLNCCGKKSTSYFFLGFSANNDTLVFAVGDAETAHLWWYAESSINRDCRIYFCWALVALLF